MLRYLCPDTVVAHLAARCPETVPVFERFGVDCRGSGGKGLAEVCRDRQLSYAAVLMALTGALAARRDPENWSTCPLTDVTTHIVANFHGPLRRELPRLEQELSRLQGQGQSHRRVLHVLLQELSRLRGEMESHMEAEEREVFPFIEDACYGRLGAGDGGRFTHLRATVESQHADAGQTLRIFRQITDAFRPPQRHGTMHDLYRGLEELERLALSHTALEVNVLLPRAAHLVSRRGEA